MLPVDSMEIYSFRRCFDRRVHSTVMQVRHALTWHLPVYLLMISHFFHVLHDSESTGREASTAAFTPRGFTVYVKIAPEKKKKKKNSNYSLNQRFELFYALIISLSLSRTCSRGVCVRNTVPLPLTSR